MFCFWRFESEESSQSSGLMAAAGVMSQVFAAAPDMIRYF